MTVILECRVNWSFHSQIPDFANCSMASCDAVLVYITDIIVKINSHSINYWCQIPWYCEYHFMNFDVVSLLQYIGTPKFESYISNTLGLIRGGLQTLKHIVEVYPKWLILCLQIQTGITELMHTYGINDYYNKKCSSEKYTLLHQPGDINDDRETREQNFCLEAR